MTQIFKAAEAIILMVKIQVQSILTAHSNLKSLKNSDDGWIRRISHNITLIPFFNPFFLQQLSTAIILANSILSLSLSLQLNYLPNLFIFIFSPICHYFYFDLNFVSFFYNFNVLIPRSDGRVDELQL